MKINEIFGSIDGEGLRTGELATFIRTFKCNLHCSYCDTLYAVDGDEFIEMSTNEVVSKVKEIGYKNITLTGGEPLIAEGAEELVDKLIAEGFDVNIETNGATDFTPYLNKNCVLCVDYKTPFSKMSNLMKEDLFSKLRETDVVKFVMAERDFAHVKNFLSTHNIKAWIYFSPVFGEIEPRELVDFMKKLHEERIINEKHTRVQIQLHKVLWEPSKRGV